MKNYYLKAADAETMNTVLRVAGLIQETPELVSTAPGVNLDIIGLIYKPTGNLIQGDEISYPEMAPIGGYHANLRAVLTEEQEAALSAILISTPAAPQRVWA